RRTLPYDAAEKAHFLAHVAAVPAQEHLAQLLVGHRHDGVDDAGALVDAVVAGFEDVVGHRAVFAERAALTEELLRDPALQHAAHGFGAIGSERARAAVHRAVGALRGAQEVEGQHETHVEHTRNDAGAAVVDADLAGDRADLGVAERPGHGEQGIGIDHAVGIDGYHDLALAAAESGFECCTLAAVLRKTQRRDKTGKACSGALDVCPGVVAAAVVDDENL